MTDMGSICLLFIVTNLVSVGLFWITNTHIDHVKCKYKDCCENRKEPK